MFFTSKGIPFWIFHGPWNVHLLSYTWFMNQLFVQDWFFSILEILQ